MSKILFDEQPIVVSRELAKLIGLNEAIVLQQVHYWLEINRKANKNFHEGRYWSYNSIRAWHEENFDFWSFNTVQRTFAKLEKMGLLLSANFNKDPRDKTKWYSINEIALKKLEKSITPKWENGEKPVKSKVSPITPKWGNALEQNGVMQNSNLGQPLPEISTEISTEISKVSQSVIEQPRNKKEPIGQTDRQTQKENMNLICKGLEEQLQLDYVKEAYPLDLNIIEDIKLNIFDMYFSDYTIIGGQKKPKELIRSVIMKLTYSHIVELISKYQDLSLNTKIKNTKSYIQTMIYNLAIESNLSVTNQVNYNMGIVAPES